MDMMCTTYARSRTRSQHISNHTLGKQPRKASIVKGKHSLLLVTTRGCRKNPYTAKGIFQVDTSPNPVLYYIAKYGLEGKSCKAFDGVWNSVRKNLHRAWKQQGVADCWNTEFTNTTKHFPDKKWVFSCVSENERLRHILLPREPLNGSGRSAGVLLKKLSMLREKLSTCSSRRPERN